MQKILCEQTRLKIKDDGVSGAKEKTEDTENLRGPKPLPKTFDDDYNYCYHY